MDFVGDIVDSNSDSDIDNVDKINVFSVLSFDIIRIIISFIGDINNNNLINFTSDISCLCSINNHYYTYRINYCHDYHYSLSKECSYRYYHDKRFQRLISSKLSSQQLSCDLSSYPWNITKLDVFSNLHKLKLSYCLLPSDISFLSNINTLDISCTTVKDVDCLQNVYDLNLYCCRFVKDISKLINVKVLNIRGCSGISSVVGLKSIEKLTLSYRQTELIGIRDLNDVVIKWT